jgi:hypothetical protein
VDRDPTQIDWESLDLEEMRPELRERWARILAAAPGNRELPDPALTRLENRDVSLLPEQIINVTDPYRD